MQTRRWIASCLAAALLTPMVPAAALASDDRSPVRTPVLTRDAIDAAVSRVIVDQRPVSRAAAETPRAPRAPRVRRQGGKGMMIMTIVSTVVGLGATYYFIKEMNKRQDTGSNNE